MDFGSSYILREDEETEAASDNEEGTDEEYSGFECEVMEFDDDEKGDSQPQVNTNTVKLEMKKLEEPPDVMVEISKLVTCGASCGAVYSHLAKLDPGTIDTAKGVWICNFCGHKNEFEGVLPDLSDKSDVMYVDDPKNPPKLQPADSSAQRIIFAIDTSNSMCQTSPMQLSQARPVLRKIYYQEQEKQARKLQIPVSDMLQIGQCPDIIYISWLQAIKASVIEAIDDLSKSDKSDTLVGLVTFDDVVTIYGDGIKNSSVIVRGGQLADWWELHERGAENAALNPIRESRKSLTEKIEVLNEQGFTALGPALIIAQEMAYSAPGSKIILCTDGFANIGLGKLDNSTDEEINQFYGEIIENSTGLGVSISVICLDDAGLNTKLGDVPKETGGWLAKIQASEFGKELAEVFKREMVAMRAKVKFVVHKDMYVGSTKDQGSKCSQYTEKIGNLHLDKTMSFSFSFKPSTPAIPVEGAGPSTNQETETKDTQTTDDRLLPFQVQITYTNLSGEPVTRVWTAERKITTNRNQAEDAMSPTTVVGNFIQESSQKLLIVNRERKGNVVELVFKLLVDGNVNKKKLNSSSSDEDLKEKLDAFLALLSKIAEKRHITEDQIAELNTLQEARAS